MDRYTPGWMSYFLSGTTAVVLSWALVGCKFGNHPGGFEPTDHMINLYLETEASGLTYCAALEGESDPRCGSLSLTRLPSWTRQLISNPLGIQIQSVASTQAALFNAFAEDPIGLSTRFQVSTGTLAYDEEYSPDPFWFADQSCLSHFFLSQSGAATFYETPIEVSGLKTAGRLALDLTALTDYAGEGCAQAFSEIQACYQDAEQCDESSSEGNLELQRQIISMFAAYVDSGALAPEDIHRILALGYQVSYR